MTRRPAPHEWPEAATALLRRLWITGMSCKLAGEAIGKETGFWPTRNAVAGKASRLGLPGRVSPIRRDKPARLPRKPSGISVTKTRDPRRLDTAPQAGRETDRRAELPARPEAASGPVLRPGSECQWLTGERPNWTKCGKPCIEGQSWCPEHAEIVWKPNTGDKRINPRQDSDVQTVKHRVAFKRAESKWSL